jgi:hypothetical protein
MQNTTIKDLLDQLDAEGAIEKTAGLGVQGDDPMVKVAEDLFAGGRLLAKGFVAELQKQASDTVPPSTADANVDHSKFRQVATSIQARHGAGPAKPTVGDAGTGGVTEKKIEGQNPGVVYESLAPKQQAPQTGEAHGNK